ncbi:MAG TPA: hypothetical protein VGE21_01275 [Flavobacteriales bacterium]
MKHTLLLIALSVSFQAFAQEPPRQTFHANGRLESTQFTQNGTDRFITYYESGRVKEMGAFLEGRKHGEWKQFAENGTILAQARFAQGHRIGTWEFRDGSNAVQGKLNYTDGRLVSGEQYQAGELVAQRTY